MSRLQEPSSLKRKQPESRSPLDSLTEHERIIYNVIRSKQDMGIWMQDMKRVAKVPDNVANKALKSLETKKLIKEVVNIQKRGKKHYVAAELEPSTEITGGAWYSNGKMDFVVINILKDQCLKWIYKQRVVTLEGILDEIRKSGIANVELTTVQIEELVRALVLDNEVVEVIFSECLFLQIHFGLQDKASGSNNFAFLQQATKSHAAFSNHLHTNTC